MPLPTNGYVKTLQMVGNGSRGIAVTDDGILLRTNDAGETWSQINLLDHIGDGVDMQWGAEFTEIRFDDALEVGTWIDYCQIFYTTDAGQSWTRFADNLQDTDDDLRCVNRAVRDSISGMLLADVHVGGRILTSGQYLFRSDDDGDTWIELCSLDEVGLYIESIQSCDTMEGLPELWLRLDDGFVNGSFDAVRGFGEELDGDIFVRNRSPLPEQVMPGLSFLGMKKDSVSDRIWFDDEERLAYTDDDGESWHVVSSGMPPSDSWDFSLGVERGFAVLQYQYLAISEDVGKTWHALNDEPLDISAFISVPDINQIVIASDIGVSFLDTQTLEWNDVSTFNDVEYIATTGDVIWAFAGDGAIHRSASRGKSWQRLPLSTEDEWFDIEAVRCTADRCNLLGSRDDSAVANLSADPFEFEVTELSEYIPNLDDDYVLDVLFSDDLQRGWLATDAGLIFGSEDGGRSWSMLGSIQNEINAIKQSPGGKYFIVHGSAAGYLWSNDGKTFERKIAPIGSDGYLGNLCWISDSTVLLSAEIGEDGDELYLASDDGGASWGPTSWFTYDENCLLPGGLVFMHGSIAAVRDTQLK